MSNGYTPGSESYRSKITPKNIPAQTADQYFVGAGFVERSKLYYGRLRVVRLTDKRVIFPYEGAADIGPFQSRPEAVAAALSLGEKLVQSDLSTPE